MPGSSLGVCAFTLVSTQKLIAKARIIAPIVFVVVRILFFIKNIIV
jgi:hypothetical protein